MLVLRYFFRNFVLEFLTCRHCLFLSIVPNSYAPTGGPKHESWAIKGSAFRNLARCTADYHGSLRCGAEYGGGSEKRREVGGVCQYADGECHFIAGGIQKKVSFHRNLSLPGEHAETTPQNSTGSSHAATRGRCHQRNIYNLERVDPRQVGDEVRL